MDKQKPKAFLKLQQKSMKKVKLKIIFDYMFIRKITRSLIIMSIVLILIQNFPNIMYAEFLCDFNFENARYN